MLARFFLAILMALSASAAAAETYPDRPVTLIVPYAAGGGSDVTARVVDSPVGTDLAADRVLVRPSFAGYNDRADLERLLAALEAELGQREAP